MSGPGAKQWWSLSLVRENGDVRPVAGQPPIQWHRTREQARGAYRERLAALKAGAGGESRLLVVCRLHRLGLILQDLDHLGPLHACILGLAHEMAEAFVIIALLRRFSPIQVTWSSRRRSYLVAAAVSAVCALFPATKSVQAAPPYPPSLSITGMTLHWSTYRKLALNSDNWPSTWASDGFVYTSFGDGTGFGGNRVSLGFARLAGSSARTVRGVNLPGRAPDGKSYGVLALGHTLYAFVSPGSGATNYDEARLYAAPLGTNAWRPASWAFAKDDPAHLILPTFLQAGRDYAGGGLYVYVYARHHAPTGVDLSVQGLTAAR